ncbi:MAG: GNAT family N-acetyltransferase [Pseudomonadota bacterium]
MNLTLCPAKESDFDFSFIAKSKAMRPHIEPHWGWDEAWQLALHTQRWGEKPWFVIMLDKLAIGTVSILNDAESCRLGEFYLLPQYQGKGIGSLVLTQVLASCDELQLSIRLEYLKWNPVGALYKRNGFVAVSENEIHYFLVRSPAKVLPTTVA